MQKLSEAVGFPEDQLRIHVIYDLNYVVCLFGAIAVAPIFRLLPTSGLKHIFSIVFSISCCLFCLGPLSWLHSFLSSLVAYGILKFLPRHRSHIIVFVWAFGYMSASHIYRMYVDYMGWTLDFTGPQMVLTLKLVAVAFCYADGARTNITDAQKKRALVNLPSLIDFYGYVYFYPSFLAGPVVEFMDYQRFVSGSLFYDDVCNGKIPSTVLPALEALGIGLMNMVVLGKTFSLDELVRSYKEGKESLGFRTLRFFISPVLLRTRYYFGWKVAEAAFTGCGFSYNGKGIEKDPSQLERIWRFFRGEPEPSIQWDRATNVRINSVELGTNIREISMYWNKRTGDWLRDYIYLRVPKKLVDPTMATFIVSAFWHGFYPGYYLFFVFLSLAVTASREVRRIVRPLFQINNATRVVYDVITTLTSICVMNYAGVGFALLGWQKNVEFYGTLFWMGHVIVIIAYAISLALAALRPREKEGSAATVIKKDS